MTIINTHTIVFLLIITTEKMTIHLERERMANAKKAKDYTEFFCLSKVGH